jgi:hypothetical protein
MLLASTDWQTIEAFCLGAILRATKILEGTVWGGLLRLPADHANGVGFFCDLLCVPLIRLWILRCTLCNPLDVSNFNKNVAGPEDQESVLV